uniref:Putative tick salivary metalloprotease n=1 Tax=Rhipicephalus pulchellus TaxID=72859 RepID=L7LQL4_RHIPC
MHLKAFGCREMIGLFLMLRHVVCCFAHKEAFIYPSVVEERTTAGKLVLKLNDDITLNLERSSVLAKNLRFITAYRSRHRLSMIDTSSIQDNLYHDPQWQSSLKVLRKDGTVQVEGIIDSKRRIKPLLQSKRSSQGQVLHSIYEVEEIRPGPTHGRSLQSAMFDLSNKLHPTARTAGPVDSFTVELHVVSDEYHQKHFFLKKSLIEYLAITVTAVNVRFQDTEGPRISFKLVGVTRSYHDVFASQIVGVLDAWKTLDGLVNYTRDGHISGNFDVVYLMTGRQMASIRSTGDVDRDVAGLAYVGKVCTIYGVAEGEDIAESYAGVHTMAHELAHTLGATHDPQDSSNCAWSKGFLMSYVENGANKYRLSSCSQTKIKDVVKLLTINCITETASITFSTNTNGVMPGQRITPDVYCKLKMRMKLRLKKIYTNAYSFMPSNLAKTCKMKCCYNVGPQKWCQITDILEGMNCTDGNTCKKGICGSKDKAEK